MYNAFKAIIALLLFQNAICQDKPAITIFIHGTLPPIINHIIHALEAPLGLTKASDLHSGFIHKQIAFALSQADSSLFPFEHIYFFGWSGHLSVNDRLNESHNLYHALKNLDGNITLICHSHGCNVALNLAKIATMHCNNTLSIDRLILLAGPVQEATKQYVHSPIFKEIFSFYSSADVVQIIDPQGLQRKNNLKWKKNFFSRRLWPHDKKLIQIKTNFKHRPVLHIDFILKNFMRYLPQSINQIIKLKQSSTHSNFSLFIDQNKKTIKIV